MNVIKVSNYIRSLIYKTREPLYNQISKVIFLNIKVALKPNIFNKIILNFYGLQTRNISAHFILNFINFRLSQYIPINPILNEMINKIKKNSTEIYGFKILVTGRLTRKERASIILRGHGLVQTSQKSANIEYASGFKIMKFGVAGIKVWINRKKSTPFYYNFKYIYE